MSRTVVRLMTVLMLAPLLVPGVLILANPIDRKPADRASMPSMPASALHRGVVVTVEDAFYAPFATVLASYVDPEGLVDYSGLQRRGRADLEAFMTAVAEAEPDKLATDAEKVAFWINAYNAVVLWQVVERYPIDSVQDVGSFFGLVGGFFKKRYPVAGRPMHADNIEHDTLRAKYSDARIHWALVCAAFGCPRLLQRPYRAGELDSMLSEQAFEFLAQPRGLKLDRTSNTIYLSKYFDWYTEDFESESETVIDYILRYSPPEPADFIRERRNRLRLRHMDYDWTLNDQRLGPRSSRSNAP